VFAGPSFLWAGQGGVILIVTAAVCACALAGSASVRRVFPHALPTLYGLVALGIATELVLTTWYLFVPGYMDHIEASVASNVHYFKAGMALYPRTDSYTFHGLLYGPLLVELNSLGYLIPASVLSAKIVGWIAAWSALAVIVALSRGGSAGSHTLLGAAYALCLLVSFGGELTTDRAEPILLLSAALALAVAMHFRGVTGASILGLLCGAVSALKLHAPLYCAAPVLIWYESRLKGRWRQDAPVMALAFALSALIGAAFPFIPQNISIHGYLEYLVLATRHGANARLLLLNGAYMLGMWAPVLVLIGSFANVGSIRRSTLRFAIALFATECVVVLVASKPGAGVHHFIPFLASHAYLFQQLYVETAVTPVARVSSDARAAAALAATVIAMIFPTLHTQGQLLVFNDQAPILRQQRDELLGFYAEYPGGMVGVAGNESYALANLRPWLTLHGALQTDYGAYMDMKLSGVDDTALRDAFDACRIANVFMPKPGEPFTLASNYGGSLFSDVLRSSFERHYRIVARGDFFDVFSCAAGQPQPLAHTGQ
jgi:hypothetical protein